MPSKPTREAGTSTRPGTAPRPGRAARAGSGAPRRPPAARAGAAAARDLHGEPAYLETGKKRVFAAALDWPGWCRSGREEASALEALSSYADRFEPVASKAGLGFRFDESVGFDVLERLSGSATTDFGAPGAIRAEDDEPMDSEELRRTVALVQASWAMFSEVVAAAPARLRKGPRGGGRDRDAVADHVVAAEIEYARKLGVPRRKLTATDTDLVDELRGEVIDAIGHLATGGRDRPTGWPARYAARRIAWHVLDHTWEIEDRSV